MLVVGAKWASPHIKSFIQKHLIHPHPSAPITHPFDRVSHTPLRTTIYTYNYFMYHIVV